VNACATRGSATARSRSYGPPFLNSAGRKELLIANLLDPTPEFEPDSKMVRFDIVVYRG